MARPKGTRIFWSGTSSLPDVATVRAFLAQAAAAHGLGPIGAAEVRTGPRGTWAVLPLDQGYLIVRHDGEKLRISVEVDGSVDRAALKNRVRTSFPMQNPTIVEDETAL